MLPYVFDVFVQGQRSLDRPEGGLGLGLPLVKQLVELHGGRVGVRSEGPGRGERVRGAPSPVDRPAGSQAGGGPGGAAVGAGGCALIEDHADAARRSAAARAVGPPGRGGRGRRARPELLRTWSADVALIDLGLPGLDGYALARAARAAHGARRIFLVALTGYGQPEDRQGWRRPASTRTWSSPSIRTNSQRLLA